MKWCKEILESPKSMYQFLWIPFILSPLLWCNNLSLFCPFSHLPRCIHVRVVCVKQSYFDKRINCWYSNIKLQAFPSESYFCIFILILQASGDPYIGQQQFSWFLTFPSGSWNSRCWVVGPTAGSVCDLMRTRMLIWCVGRSPSPLPPV